RDEDRMPPEEAAWQPTDAERLVIQQWVQQGAAWEGHWADQPVSRPPVPVSQFPEASRGTIDAFLHAQQAKRSLRPSIPADRQRWARRMSLVLTGLPADPHHVRQLEAATSPIAQRRLTDRLLASPAFGEHVGAWWLDQARYGDSNGFERDRPREMWHYRDWLIQSINDDMPLDQFTIESLAGDLLPEPTESQLLASGFHRNSMIHDENGVHEDQFKDRTIKDRLETTATVWLASTIGCAQCHDHKHDPLSQEEYYKLYAVFANTTDRTVSSDDIVFDQKNYDAVESYLADRSQRDRVEQEIESLTAQLKGRKPGSKEAAKKTSSQTILLLSLFGMAAIGCVVAIYPKGRKLGGVLFLGGLAGGGYVAATGAGQGTGAVLSVEKYNAMAERGRALEAELKELNRRFRVWTLVMNEGPVKETRFQIRGDFQNLGDPVQPGVPGVYGLPVATSPERGYVDRLQLAKWLVDPKHPRTSRVLANRLWALAWGTPLVATDRDFGYRGDKPTHPELLDHLANRLVDDGWSTKRLLRRIVTSHSFGQSSSGRTLDSRLASHSRRGTLVTAESDSDPIESSTNFRDDPRNQWYSRGPRYRMSAEMIRDVRLASANLLDRRIGGVAAYPHQPPEVWDDVFKGMDNVVLSEWLEFDGWPRYRRDVYTYVRRAATHPVRAAFDAPNRRTCTTIRPRTMTAAQALVVLNEPTCVESAAATAVQSMVIGSGSASNVPEEESRLRWLYQRIVGHAASKPVIDRLLTLLNDARQTYRSDTQMAASLVSNVPSTLKASAAELAPAELASTIVVCNVLNNLDASLTIN
ncbi:MAG: DUF1549 and DUF1553 domain-containing protein, partial [Planctomycetota bacterium]